MQGRAIPSGWTTQSQEGISWPAQPQSRWPAAERASALPAAADPLAEFDYGAVELTGGPLKQQYDRIHAAYLALDNDRLLRVYRERAGLPAPGEPMGGWYGRDGFVPGHSLGQYISGLARIGRTTGDAGLRGQSCGPGRRLCSHSRSEGSVLCRAQMPKTSGPATSSTSILPDLMDAYQSERRQRRRAILLPRVFHGALPYIPERGHDRIGKKDPPYDETYVLPESLFLAYELTGDRAFYDRAMAYLLDRDYFDPLAAGQDVLPGRHAYSHVIALSSAGKARLVLGDEKYLRAMQNASHLLQSTQQFATGGWGPNETFIEPHKGQLCDEPAHDQLTILRRPAAVTRPSNWRVICSAPPAMRAMAMAWSASSSMAFWRSKSQMPTAIIPTTPPMERRRTRFSIRRNGRAARERSSKVLPIT